MPRRLPTMLLAIALLGACTGGELVPGPTESARAPTSPRASGASAPVMSPGATGSGIAGARNPAPYIEGQPYAVAIDPADFVDTVDNPFFPLVPGTVLRYEGESDGEAEVVEITVTDETREILGVTATVVRDVVTTADGDLKEETLDWFAQDRAGNVWYFGEETAEYEGGEVVTTAGSWEAGVDGAQPGIVMLADPQPGDTYRQEFYTGEAEDVGKVLSLNVSVVVPFDSFTGVLETEDWTPLEPDVLEHKFYAQGIGVVYEEVVAGGAGSLSLVEVKRP